jgi:cytochrome b6-f complex iron-sulfur subunit
MNVEVEGRGIDMNETKTQKAGAGSTEADATFAVSRRKTLKGLLGFLGAIGLGNIFYGLYRFLAPGAGGEAAVEITAGEVPEGTALPFLYGGSPGILFRAGDGAFTAFSLVCTHLACTVSWNPEKREFYCPCHEGFFDAEGKVLSGPPPAPLDRLKVEVRGEKVIIGA